MSTFLGNWSAVLLALLEKQSGDDRRYAVCGKIAFHAACYGGLEDTTALREAILTENAAEPWRDLRARKDGGMGTESIGYLSPEHTIQRPSPSDPPRYWFSIYPGPWKILRRQQVYAYERYLEALAGRLAQRRIPGVKAVHVVLEMVTASDTFPCDTAANG